MQATGTAGGLDFIYIPKVFVNGSLKIFSFGALKVKATNISAIKARDTIAFFGFLHISLFSLNRRVS